MRKTDDRLLLEQVLEPQICQRERECSGCATSCQSACKTSCTVGNQSCEEPLALHPRNPGRPEMPGR